MFSGRVKRALLAALLLCASTGVVAVLVSQPGLLRTPSHNADSGAAGASAAAIPQTEGGLSLPEEEGAWMISYRSGGGLAGQVKQGVITSSGEVTTGPAADVGQFRFSCRTRLADGDARLVRQLIQASNPAAWRARYVDPQNPDGCCDQFFYTLTLRRRRATGEAEAYTASWYDSSSPLMPGDLSALHKVTTEIDGKALEGCKGA